MAKKKPTPKKQPRTSRRMSLPDANKALVAFIRQFMADNRTVAHFETVRFSAGLDANGLLEVRVDAELS